MLLARPVLLAIGICAAAGGCRPEADRIARAAAGARPHLESFERFERWARRAAVADGASRGRGALGELVFAPLRHAPQLIGAWVRLEGDRPLLLALPAGAELPASARWVPLRDPGVGALQVASLDRCSIGVAAGDAQTPPACVLISRAGDGADDLRAVNVTMAFASATR
jgi:hypothetical protein